MPALRNGHPALLPRNRRRSSHLALFMPAKPGIYGVGIQQPLPSPSTPPTSISHLPPRPISFAPNVTPVTFVESEDSSEPSTPEPYSPNSLPKLFPPSETPAPPPTRKRCPPGKRRSQGYIPRPPNAFMLFRADFVRQKHVPGSIETNHGSLSKIIGNCWRSLPLDEKKVWEQRAKHEKAAHKVQYPNYRFRPVHNKNKKTKGDDAGSASQANSNDDRKKLEVSPEEEMRCEEVTQLLLEGKKGEELVRAVRELEQGRKYRMEGHAVSQAHHQLMMPPRSVPFNNGIMSAPQPTYPNSVLPGGNSNFFNQDGSTSFLHLRRSSSVPLPGSYGNGGFDFNFSNFGFGGGASTTDFYLPPPTYHDSQHQSESIAIPSVPFLPPPSSSGISGLANSSLNSDGSSDSHLLTVGSISRQQQRMILGHRRSSSAGAAFGAIQRSWTAPFASNNSYGYGYFEGNQGSDVGDYGSGNVVLQRDDSPLPDVDLSLFDPNFLSGTSVTGSQGTPAPEDPNVPLSNAGTTHTTPNGAFPVTELMNPSLGRVDSVRYQPMPNNSDMVSPHDMVSPAESYWSNNSGSMFQQQPRQQQQGLGLEISPNDLTITNTASPNSFDQMYLAEQGQHSMGMEMAYVSANNAGYADAGTYNYGHVDMGIMQNNGVQYVEC